MSGADVANVKGASFSFVEGKFLVFIRKLRRGLYGEA